MAVTLGEGSDPQPDLWEKLILPNRKGNLTTSFPVTARQQLWYGPSWNRVIPKDTSCSHRPKWLYLPSVSGIIWLTHRALDLTVGGWRTVLVHQYLYRLYHFVWVIAGEAVGIHQLKSQKNSVSMQRKNWSVPLGYRITKINKGIIIEKHTQAQYPVFIKDKQPW